MQNRVKYIEGLLETIIWLPILFLSALLIHNGILYYRFDMDYGILPEKELALKDDLWIVCFYIHVITGICCLLIPMVNFIGRHFKLSTIWHQILGRFYVWNNLVFVAPTGMYIATYSKGGWWAEVGFVFQGALLMYFSYYGLKYSAISISKHVKFMIRSYAIAISVLTFRVLHIIFIVMKLPYNDNYALSQWLSITLNLFMAELIITYIMAKQILNIPLVRYTNI
jgi:hypothetical protein